MLPDSLTPKASLFQSWWEFTPWLPAIRGERGNGAWETPECGRDPQDCGSLPPVLKQKAEDGVKIYILLFNIIDNLMPSAAMIEHTIECLQGLHENIRVVASPGWFPIMWSQHQKFICVDRQVAIVGGIDWTMCRFVRANPPTNPHLFAQS